MIRSYLKIAWKVLQRRKFFTFISLFGISLTLAVLMVLTSFIDHLVSPNYPEVNRDRSLHITYGMLVNEKGNGTWRGASGFHFMDKYVRQMETPEKIAMMSAEPIAVDAFYENYRLKLNKKTTNAAFWEVMSFDFLEGQPFSESQVQNGEKVVVINERTRQGFFGDRTDVVGETIEMSLEKFRIIGVVKGVPITRILTSADVYVPYTTSATLLKSKNLVGGFCGILLAKDKRDFPTIQAEFEGVVAKVELPPEWPEFYTYADPYVENFLRLFGFGEDFPVNPFYLFVGIFAFLFMALPAINLVNINVSRIMERASEIGVRKAFGAASSTLVYQFIIENIIITLIGGLLGLGLSFFLIKYLNQSGLIPDLDLTINYNVLFVSLLTCLFFGLLSGVLPAYRMSKMNVVSALKAGEGS